MANEFIVRNGLIALDNSQVTGSLAIRSGTSFSIQTTNKIIATADSSDANAPIIEGLAKSDGSGAIYIKNSTNTSFRAGFGIDSGGSLTYANYTTGGIVFYANSQYRMRLFGPTGNIVLKSVSDPTTYVDAGFRLDVDGTSRFIGNSQITGSLIVTAGITGSLFGTASWASNAVTSSYILNAVSASFASTASSVNTLNQNVIISGSLTVFTGSAIEFQVTNTGTKLGNLLTDIHTVTGSLNITGSENVRGSGSAVFTVDGTSGRLFSVDDSLSGSLFSVNTAAGLPVVEAFSDNTVRIGQYGQRALFVSQSRVGIGKETALNAVLDVSGSVVVTGSVNLTAGSYNLLATGGQNLFFNNSGQLGSSATGTHITMNPAGNTTTFSQVVTTQNGFNATPGGNATTYALRTTVGAYPSAILASFTSGSVTVLSISGSGMISTGSFNHLGNLSIAGTITAQTLVVQTITSSTDFVTGSTRFGSLLANTHQFTGSVSMTGSLNVIGGNVGIGTASPAQKLDVYGGIASYGFLALYANGGADDIYLNARVLQNVSTANQDGMYIGFNNTGTTAAHLRFYANGTNERMRIDASTGNVGIGTTSPFAKLSIAADDALRLQGNNAYMSFFNGANNVRSGYLQINAAGVGTYLTDEVNGAINFLAGGSTRQIITAAGNVGIGTTSPTSLLHLKAASNPVIRLEGASDSGYVDYNGTRLILSAGAGYMGFVTGTAEYMRLDGSGNLGIGTTSPQVRLDVKGTSTGTLTGMALFRDASTNGNGLVVRAGTGVVNLLATWIDSGINTDLTFTPTTSGGAQNEAMRITSAGNIGIGTTSPDASSLLDITSTTKGFLPPRMSEEERDNIASPAAGLMVFVTNTAKLSVFDGGSWRYLAYE